MRSNRVQWDRVDSRTYEQMVAVLLSRLHPDVVRIDGSGGDGGRDALIEGPDGLEIFEMKRFVGRMTPTRRRQVERSLARALTHAPHRWHLVVPIDPTPAERTWFKRITGATGCECHWHGLRWLESELAQRPDILRYYTAGSAEEVIALMRELQMEQGAFANGVVDAVDRLKSMAARLNELDPHYAFALSSQPDGSVSVSLFPKYRGAENDRPVTFGSRFAFSDDEAGRAAAAALNDALDYGTPIVVPPEFVKSFTVDAPAGLGASFESGEIAITPSADPFPPDVRLAFRLVGEAGEPLAELPLHVRNRGVGRRGATFDLADSSGLFTAMMRVDPAGLKMKFTFEPAAGALPAAILPVARVIRLAAEGGKRGVVVLNGEASAAPSPFGGPIDPAVEEWLWVVESLEVIQRASNIFFPMPDELSPQELRAIARAAALLDGETVHDTWSSVAMVMDLEGLAKLREGPLGRGEETDLTQQAQLVLQIASYEIPLGTVRRDLPTVRVAEWPNPSSLSQGQDVEVRLVPGTDSGAVTRLVRGEGSSTPQPQN